MLKKLLKNWILLLISSLPDLNRVFDNGLNRKDISNDFNLSLKKYLVLISLINFSISLR